MSYAIRNDRQGWRAVDSLEDVLEGEYYSNEPIEIVKAVTYATELADLNTAYQLDVDAFSKAFSNAYLADGPSQESKQLNIRNQYVARKAVYVTDYNALRSKYGV